MRVIYPYKDIKGKTVLIEENELEKDFPIAYKYLLSHKDELLQRKDSRKTFSDREDWYTLTRFGRIDMFSKRKIVFPGETKEHKFGIDTNGSGYSGARVFSVTLNNYDDTNFDIESLLGILNSSLIQFFLHSTAPVKQGGYYSYSSTVVSQVPMPPVITSQLTEIVKKIMAVHAQMINHEINFIHLLQAKFSLDKPSTKLQNWPSLDFKGFLGELSKAKVKLSLAEEAEWMAYFNEQKAKAQALQADIDRLDREIDVLVYELYGLTEEEIRIVEGGEG